jgi:hypothetical protein
MVQIGRGYILGKIYGLGFFIKVLFSPNYKHDYYL